MIEHKESKNVRQYALADVAVALGWTRDRVEIVHADQGRTGQRSRVAGASSTSLPNSVSIMLASWIFAKIGQSPRPSDQDRRGVPLVRSCGLFRASGRLRWPV